jgi:nucleoid-associated protein
MLRRLIAHQILKEPHTNTAQLHLREDVLPVGTDLTASLLEQLRDSFVRRNPISGRFKSTGGTQPRFQQLLLRYLQAAEDTTFIAFTREAMQVLADEMSRQQLATGGYVIFAEYDANNTPFLLTAILSTLAKPTFDENLNLVASTTLDLDHLRHGARTRLEAVEENDDGVVHFISYRTVGVSEYFLDFIGCEAVARPEVQANRLYSGLNTWAQERELDESQKLDLLARAYSHWELCRREQRPITLTALANATAPDDPQGLLTHLSQEDLGLAGEFSPPPPSSMRRFVRFSFNANGLRLEFDRNQWENRIIINRQKRTLTIRNIPETLITAFDEGD